MKYLGLIFFVFSLLTVSVYSQESEVLTISDEEVQIEGNLSVNGTIQDQLGFIIPKGTIMPFGGNSAPEGWFLCDGFAISRTEFADLFAVIGTNFGDGDKTTTFTLPDLRGVFLRGAGENGTMEKANGEAYDGNIVGTEQNDVVSDHTHDINHDHPEITATTTIDGKHSHGVTAYRAHDSADTYVLGVGNTKYPARGIGTSENGAHDHDVPVDLPELGEQSSGGVDSANTGDETAPASVSVNYIIKY